MGKAMGRGLVIATTLLLFMCCTKITALGGYGDEVAAASDHIHVQGKVLCQDCTKGWKDWVQGSPIKGSVVSITCMDERGKIVQYASDETDEYGQYDFTVDLTCGVTKKKINPKGCRARLVSSPDSSCDIFTNFGDGLTGVRLARPTSVYRDSIKYSLEPFYFTSPMCQKPDTGDSPAADGNNDNY